MIITVIQVQIQRSSTCSGWLRKARPHQFFFGKMCEFKGKIKKVKDVKRSDGLWGFACGNVLYCHPLLAASSLMIHLFEGDHDPSRREYAVQAIFYVVGRWYFWRFSSCNHTFLITSPTFPVLHWQRVIKTGVLPNFWGCSAVRLSSKSFRNKLWKAPQPPDIK